MVATVKIVGLTGSTPTATYITGINTITSNSIQGNSGTENLTWRYGES